MELPILYRGDGDYRGDRDLKRLFQQGLVATNLVNGGFGREIFETPLRDSIKKHVNYKWTKTHFLSFSEDVDRAFTFGIGQTNPGMKYENYYEEDNLWDFLVITLDCKTLLSVTEIADGVFSAHFEPSFLQFKPKYNLVLIDVVKALRSKSPSNDEDRSALANAEKDKEWLILPALAKDFGNSIEFRGLLDCVVFSGINRYKLVT